MTALLWRCEAPTDAQLAYVASLAREHGFQPPAVHSKEEASRVIGELRAGTFRQTDYPGGYVGADDEVPF